MDAKVARGHPAECGDATVAWKPYRRTMKVARLAVVVALVVSGCSFDNMENPYRDLDSAPSAEQILESLNLASLGLRTQPCSLFGAPVARCYSPDSWMGIREGRETLGYVHRELLAAGARFWGSSESPTTSRGAPRVARLDLGCYFDYETGDFPLRVVIVGPSGEAEPCVNGLPGDGVSQVWIIGSGFVPEEHYVGVVMPDSLALLLQSLPPRLVRADEVYGGTAATVDGYYGPELPRLQDSYGVHILLETVSVKNGIARGLVQYGGDTPSLTTTEEPGQGDEPSQPTLVQRGTTGAVGVVIEAGRERYSVPIVIRLGESAPFEITLSKGFEVDDLRVVPGWTHTNVDWRGGQRFSGPTSDPQCGQGVGEDGANVSALAPGEGEECQVVEAQATTTAGTRISVEAVVATFAEDGTVTEVTDPFILAQGIEPVVGTASIIFTDINLAWRAPTGSAPSTGVWIRYAKQADIRAE
ncbi:MAG: hypothetical protein MUP36_03375 [Demequinaceae bacterium]|nr:hypothetical protein [Demequinaceae bacterium]